MVKATIITMILLSIMGFIRIYKDYFARVISNNDG